MRSSASPSSTTSSSQGRIRLLLEGLGAWLLMQPSLTNARKRCLLPVVRNRSGLAHEVARYLGHLGLRRPSRTWRRTWRRREAVAMRPGRTDPLSTLRAARGLIANPERWTRSAPARRWKAAHGRAQGEWLPTHATVLQAGKFRAVGALCAASGTRTGPPGIAFLDAASRQLFGMWIGRANDDGRFTHADILRCYDTAIASFLSLSGGLLIVAQLHTPLGAQDERPRDRDGRRQDAFLAPADQPITLDLCSAWGAWPLCSAAA